jgi:DNA polymerase III epsilon subunit-like protein
MISVLVLDTETTGISKTDQVIELAYIDLGPFTFEQLRSDREDFEIFKQTPLTYISRFRFKPTVPINPHAYEIHGIGLSELKDSPCSTTVAIPYADYIVGHVISFDQRMLEQSNFEMSGQLAKAKYICTKELAKAVEKAIGIKYENHKLDTLVKYYYPAEYESLVQSTHDARGDVIKTIVVLLAMLEHLPAITSWEELYNFQQSLKKVKSNGTGK